MQICSGVDIEDIARFKSEYIGKQAFLDLCFTKDEQIYCQSKANPAQHYAVRFAAKEAVIKALSGFNLYLEKSNIEILNHPSGRPYVKFHSENPEILSLNTDISLSHSPTSAVAFVILYSLRLDEMNTLL